MRLIDADALPDSVRRQLENEPTIFANTLALDKFDEVLQSYWISRARLSQEHPDEYTRGEMNLIWALRYEIRDIKLELDPPADLYEALQQHVEEAKKRNYATD